LLATDDAMLLESAGYRVAVVEGEEANFKITTIEDLRRAEQLLAREG
jgi:2-C-methyl-D-erythritol 4-phosphate cytidylyltransferase